ncbi:unnamed protein product [Brassica oleracea var. botrytis]
MFCFSVYVFCWHFAISNKLVFKAWMYARNSYRASFLASSSRRLYFEHLSLVEFLSYINPCHLFLFHPHLFLSTAGRSYLKGVGVSAENPSDTFLTLGSVAVSKVVHLLLQNMEMSKKIESITLSEPNDYILNSPPQVSTLMSTYDLL